jgi:hypothetical protein
MNLQNLPTKLETEKSSINQKKIDLRDALIVAFDRTRTEPFDVTLMINDVLDEFKRLDTLTIRQALRNGGLGKYGRTYKLSTQEVCYWIREYIKPIKQDRL